VHDRLLCEVTLVGSIKRITLRSTYKLVNCTMYPLELTLVDEAGQPLCAIRKLGEAQFRWLEMMLIKYNIAPQEDFAVPIENVLKSQIRVQPDREYSLHPAYFRLDWELYQKASNISGPRQSSGKIFLLNRHRSSSVAIPIRLNQFSVSRLPHSLKPTVVLLSK
jgi:hypothetical protein